MKLKLTITVDYKPNGTPASDLEKQLHISAQYLAGEGMLKGDTNAEVIEWDYSTEEIQTVSIHNLDLSNPRHAKAFMVEVNRYISCFPADKSAQEIKELIEQEAEEISAWEPFEDYSNEQILEFILDATIDRLNS